MRPHRQLFYAYTALYRPYLKQLNNELLPFHLVSPQWAVMHYLLQNGAQTISDISAYQHVELPTITKMVQKLIELGYVEARVGEDKRIRLIQLTEQGLGICRQVQDRLSLVQKNLLEDVSEEDQLLVARILRNISQKITTYKG